MVNKVRFRALLDQADAGLSGWMRPVPNEMLATTFCAVLKPIKDSDDVEAAFKLIEKCGPTLKGMAVFALLKGMADELCRREETAAEG